MKLYDNAMSPNAKRVRVLAVEDDGLILWESPAILIHLARQHGRKLFPAEHEVEALRWMFWNARPRAA